MRQVPGKRGRTFLVIVVFAMVLSGCRTTKGYEQRLSSYVGWHSDRLILSWGPPDKSAELSDGRKLIEYVHSQTFTTGGYTLYSREKVKTKNGKVWVNTPTYVPPSTHVSQCMTRFLIDRDLLVRSYSFQGSACVAEELDKPS